MLELEIPSRELFDDDTQEFRTVKGMVLRLEHSLVSMAKWESKWKKPFLSYVKKTRAEETDYFRCMTISQNVDPEIYHALTNTERQKIRDYMDDSMTATTFYELKKQPPSKDTLTAEVIYYLMFSYQIPKECEKWHLNRLLTLIRVFNVRNSTTKMSKAEILAHNRKLNKARRAARNTRG
ncbi:MAG: hypothetical protein IJ726_08890 [Phocaeicola sp.]|nr:hypothetical protein [Phocaeicola sp.]